MRTGNNQDLASVDIGQMNSQYNIDDYAYPSDLFNTMAYGQNYVMFYINVNSDSKLGRDPNTATVSDIPARERGELIGLAEREGVTTGGLFGANLVNNAGGAILSKAFGIGSAGVTAGVLSTAGQGVLAASSSNATRAQKRLKTAIGLHMPNQMQIRYSTQWSEEDAFLLSGVLGIGSDVLDAVGLGDGGPTNLQGDAAGVAIGAALKAGPNAAANSALTGLAVNPKKEQTFKGINFREFTMEYQFFPRNAKEAKNVQNIIYQFKYHMHPEFKDTSSFLYVYPSEFDIQYWVGQNENRSLHKHTSCVLTDMNINYTPNGSFAAFAPNQNDDVAGMPVQTNMVLTFRELALITKEKVEKGY